MNDKNVSFIIPVYNVEKYIEECVNSIILQSKYKSYEIILVDDGSTDYSGKICDKYASKYEFIHVIHKINGGLASARNTGLEIASGKYIAFIDSDDRLAADAASKLIKWAEQSEVDVAFMQITRFYPDGKSIDLGEHIQRKYIYHQQKINVIRYLSSRPKYPASACGKVYKRNFLEANGLCFPKDNRRSEDLGFSYDVIALAETYDVCEFPYYEYRQNREGSITNHSMSNKDFLDVNMFIEESIQKSLSNKIPNSEQDRYLLSFVAYEYALLLCAYARYHGKEKKVLFHILKNNSWVLNYANMKHVIYIKFVYKIFGLNITAQITNLCRNVRRNHEYRKK